MSITNTELTPVVWLVQHPLNSTKMKLNKYNGLMVKVVGIIGTVFLPHVLTT